MNLVFLLFSLSQLAPAQGAPISVKMHDLTVEFRLLGKVKSIEEARAQCQPLGSNPSWRLPDPRNSLDYAALVLAQNLFSPEGMGTLVWPNDKLLKGDRFVVIEHNGLIAISLSEFLKEANAQLNTTPGNEQEKDQDFLTETDRKLLSNIVYQLKDGIPATCMRSFKTP